MSRSRKGIDVAIISALGIFVSPGYEACVLEAVLRIFFDATPWPPLAFAERRPSDRLRAVLRLWSLVARRKRQRYVSAPQRMARWDLAIVCRHGSDTGAHSLQAAAAGSGRLSTS